MLSLVVARARDGAIGKDGTIPWRAPEDLAFFQRETLGGAIIMGRKTWESLPVRPLKNRLNIVVSSQSVEDAPVICRDVGSAISHALGAGYRRVYGIGGAGIYDEMLKSADRLLITEVAVDVPGADTFFPPLAPDTWHHVGATPLRDENPACVVHEYLRKAQVTGPE
ncbi:dihydrofolate reductase [Oceaniglobus trochenteri]|uniref:dihydrofolate reductase n=1 Tax=Oceaniglobus trochenteri TaxID=2763260 RepID=UPI001CFF9A35|nr:dihydrofolate reductase [Oceaniglobus trochenteri]